jgi:tetratricopeptide (TPR) repeat protein
MFKNLSDTVTVLVSVFALLFSFGTTYFSSKRDKAQDIKNLRSDLRSLLQRLASLPKENFELSQNYAANPQAIATLSSSIAQENALLARQAAEIARLLPANKVSSTEHYCIALALQNCFNNDQAVEFLERGLKVADDFNDEIALIRVYANMLFITGQIEAGRAKYTQSLNIFSKYKGYNDYTQRSTHVWTELAWAASEAGCGFKDLANQHIASAKSYVDTMMPGPYTDQLGKQINQAQAQMNPGAAGPATANG